ncbi:hypothetical protein MNB_SV-5-430 [hydrothermal vent metagenome]|uniref:Outer membrane porin, OprD family n=1 Tax=hydrothermal vent metagenome TaxID=652676 RepID=A0A1W1EF66_9ZZZZ
MKKLTIVALSTLASVALMAGGDIAPVAAPVVVEATDYGTFDGQAKIIHILDGESNGYDKNTGSALYLNLGYTTPVYSGFSARVAGGLVTDTGLRDLDGKYVAGGIYMGKKSEKDTTGTWFDFEEAYLRYQNDTVDAKAGRFRLKTPMTTIKYSTQPNLYEGVMLNAKGLIPQTKLVGGYLTNMMYGARSLADYGFIGEAGLISKAGNKPARGIHGASKLATSRGDFENFGTLALGDDAGMIVVGAVNKSIPNTKIQAWNYYVDGIANQFYADTMTTLKLDGGFKFNFGAQFLYESLDDAVVVNGDTPTIWGAMASAAYKGFKVGVGYNSSNGDQFVNAWGADPLYTTTILTRNAFRPNVDAYKVSAAYKLPSIDMIPGAIILSGAYADYGQSSLVGVSDDSTETDLVLTYKPAKNWLFRVWNVQSTSEFNTATKDRTINQSRFIASYKF